MSTDILVQKGGKRFSFFQLFEKEGYSIQVPIIQRDYAQGRKSKAEVRDLFLSALFNYLNEGIPHRDLDFVYGSKDHKVDKVFIPLDGQQRLTTLFLLHWYLANLSGNMEMFKSALFEDKRSKFSYLTRTSSREFCDALLINEIDLNNLLVNKKTNKESLSETIQNSCWYFLSWGKDPTIQSMLTMLNSIHAKFSKRPDFFNKLIDDTNPVITFLFLDLEQFGLTEDLYIKMNSRGKPLTTFENFKAKLEQHIKFHYPGDGKKYNLRYGGLDRKVDLHEYFSFNIDTKWANLFWQYRHLGGNYSTFDDELMNFIYVIAANQCAIEKEFNKELFDALSKSGSIDPETPEYISYNKLNSLGVLTKGFIDYLINALDNLTNGDEKIKSHLGSNNYFDEDGIFRNALTNKLTRVTSVQFHAYMRFLICNQEDRSGLFQWMRVVHNLTENTPINDSADVVKAIKSFENILPHSNQILKFLTDDNSKIDFFYSRQVQEERIKAHLILKEDNFAFRSAIERFEPRAFFTGQIGFILEFSGILDYFEQHGHCNWPPEEGQQYISQFLNYAEKASAAFEILQTPANIDFVLERAVLTKGNYLVPTTYNRFNLLSTNKDQRDYSWKRLLRLPPASDTGDLLWKEKRKLVKELLDDPRYIANNPASSLGKISKDRVGGWRQYFIDQPECIRYCQQGFIQMVSEHDIHLVLQFQDNSRKRELYSYDLYWKLPDDFSPFEGVFHAEINRDNEYSNVKYFNWCYNRKFYSMNVYYLPDEDQNGGYYSVMVYKAKGNKQREEFSPELISLLENRKFDWMEDELGYVYDLEKSENVIDYIAEIRQAFNELDK